MSLRSQIIRDEGIRLTAYHDSQGNCTFGVGHKGTTPLTGAAWSQILNDDIASHSADVAREMPWTIALSATRHNVLVNMCFNLGINNLLQFKEMIAALQTALDTNGSFKPVADAMLKSRWAVEVGDRAVRLAKQMETGIEQ